MDKPENTIGVSEMENQYDKSALTPVSNERPQTMIVGHSTWIDRREQEPDTSKRILVWFRNTVFVGEYIEGRWYEFTDDETLDYLNANYMYPGCLKLDFRYWMPCPEPPEMKE